MAYLGGPAVHVEAGQLLGAGQARVFAMVGRTMARRRAHGAVGVVAGDGLLVIGFVGRRDGRHRSFGGVGEIPGQRRAQVARRRSPRGHSSSHRQAARL